MLPANSPKVPWHEPCTPVLDHSSINPSLACPATANRLPIHRSLAAACCCRLPPTAAKLTLVRLEGLNRLAQGLR